MSNWTRPQEVTKVQMVFPGTVTGTLLPTAEEIPDEFFKANKWSDFASRVFMLGWDGRDPALIMKSDVDAEKAFNHFRVVLGSYEPKHENKIAGAGYLLSLWFQDVVPVDQTETEETPA